MKNLLQKSQKDLILYSKQIENMEAKWRKLNQHIKGNTKDIEAYREIKLLEGRIFYVRNIIHLLKKRSQVATMQVQNK